MAHANTNGMAEMWKKEKIVSPGGVRRASQEYSALKGSPAVRRVAWERSSYRPLSRQESPPPEAWIASSEGGDELAHPLQITVKITQDDALNTVPATQRAPN